ncbi:hypothetical protein ASN86_02021 [Streptococcus parauberis]|nr:hypothetical protein ASN86_02021 [Streptococcus parauberis]
MVKKAYSLETKLACIEMKKSGKPEKVIMDRLGIKNKSRYIHGGAGIKKEKRIVFINL